MRTDPISDEEKTVAWRASAKYLLVLLQILLLTALVLAVLYVVDRPPELGSQYRLVSAERLDSFSTQPPDVTAQWSVVTFPDSGYDQQTAYSSVWYRMSFDLDQLDPAEGKKDDRWAVYIDTRHANAAVYLNDQLLGDGGNLSPPVPVYRRPLLFSFPASMLKVEGNTLHYRYVNGTPEVKVNPVYIAPLSVIAPHYQNSMFVRATLPQGVLILMGVIMSIMMLIFLMRPHDTVYGWYSLSTLFWILHYSMRATDLVPLSSPYVWSGFSYLTLASFAFCASRYVACCVNVRFPKIEKTVLLWAVIGGAILMAIAVFGGPAVDVYGEYVWMPSALLAGCYSIAMLGIAYHRDSTTENMLLLVSIGHLFAMGIRDYLYDFTDLVPGDNYYLQFSAGLVMFVWAIILARRFAIALNTAETMNEELETRVEAKSQELQRFYEGEVEMEKERALLSERERIMRDMHDGLGGQLVQVLTLAEKNPELQPVRATLDQALRDLRMIIDSLSITDGDLMTVLGTFRYRTEKMIKQVGLKYKWQVGDLPPTLQLGPDAVLQVLRILQEAVTNIMRHANASTVTVKTSLTEADQESPAFAVIEIVDDGEGFVEKPGSGDMTDTTPSGHGVRNMEYRARSIGAIVDIRPTTSGTTVRLALPLPDIR
jgi:signal transduction histidine kinase